MSTLAMLALGLGVPFTLVAIVYASIFLAAQDEERSFPQPQNDEPGR